MKRRVVIRSSALVLALVAAEACDRGTKPKTHDDIAADSSLAADLALANRDTLLIDSIGQYSPGAGAAQDTGLNATDSQKPTVSAKAAPPAPRRQIAPRRSVGTNPRPAPSVPTRQTSETPCDSPALGDQEACVHTQLAAADKRLNGVYRALITEMRRQDGVGSGGKDPPSVVRLRTAQRAWLVHRDTECKRRGRGTEGALWARPRVTCLGEFSQRRANELADNFSRLTAP